MNVCMEKQIYFQDMIFENNAAYVMYKTIIEDDNTISKQIDTDKIIILEYM